MIQLGNIDFSTTIRYIVKISQYHDILPGAAVAIILLPKRLKCLYLCYFVLK